eukprot:jgi/Mesen1/6677/ME000343S05848
MVSAVFKISATALVRSAAATLTSQAAEVPEDGLGTKRIRLRRKGSAASLEANHVICGSKNDASQEAEHKQVVKSSRRLSRRGEGNPGAEGLQEAEEDEASIKVEPRRARSKIVKAGPTRDLEEELWAQGFQRVAGVDEAGRGPLAGPVVAAACVIPSNVFLQGINDSKKLTEVARDKLYEAIISHPEISYAVEVIEAPVIDNINILQATMRAMAACIAKLDRGGELVAPDFVLVDGNRLPDSLDERRAQFVIKGDAESYVIAAASIIAKVTRDRIMARHDERWPMYGFKNHKGYGTAAHVAAMVKHGPCEIHRRSFAPLKGWNLPNTGR